MIRAEDGLHLLEVREDFACTRTLFVYSEQDFVCL